MGMTLLSSYRFLSLRVALRALMIRCLPCCTNGKHHDQRVTSRSPSEFKLEEQTPVRRDRKPFVMDEKLTALRRQIGEVAWSDRVARAKERETLVLNFQAGVANGLTPSQAFRELGTDVTLSTIRSWAQRHAAHGLGGLIDRTGVLTTLGFQDPLPSPVRKHVKTREALSFVKWVGSKQGVLTELLRRRPPNFTDEGVLRRVSQCLKGAELRGGDFADICADAAEGDFVYFDPPYITRRA